MQWHPRTIRANAKAMAGYGDGTAAANVKLPRINHWVTMRNDFSVRDNRNALNLKRRLNPELFEHPVYHLYGAKR